MYAYLLFESMLLMSHLEKLQVKYAQLKDEYLQNIVNLSLASVIHYTDANRIDISETNSICPVLLSPLQLLSEFLNATQRRNGNGMSRMNETEQKTTIFTSFIFHEDRPTVTRSCWSYAVCF